MKPIDQALQTLLERAAQARPEPPEPPPFGFDMAVLAGWRSTRQQDDQALLVGLFRRAMIFAVTLTILSGAWNYFAAWNSADATSLASYALMQLPP